MDEAETALRGKVIELVNEVRGSKTESEAMAMVMAFMEDRGLLVPKRVVLREPDVQAVFADALRHFVDTNFDILLSSAGLDRRHVIAYCYMLATIRHLTGTGVLHGDTRIVLTGRGKEIAG